MQQWEDSAAPRSTEELLHEALERVLPAYHLALDGEPEAACAYRCAGSEMLYESDVPIMKRIVYQVNVYQREYREDIVEAVKEAVRDAGFLVKVGGQIMEGMYYRDEFTAAIRSNL